VIVPLALAGVPAALLLQQPDFGGAVTLLLITGALVFASGARLGHLAFVAALGVPVIALVAGMSPYRLRRLEMFLDPWADPLGNGYQLVQSQLAFGAGGLTGAGLGAGQQKLFYLPEAHTDFILSVIGEETGLIGVAVVLACFALIAISTLGIAARASSGFATLLALGCGLMLWLQAGLNAGVAMGALPTKGTTLPLLSYGSTSLVASLAAVGFILNVARPRQRGRSGWR
jgi:cell division protein FtsW